MKRILFFVGMLMMLMAFVSHSVWAIDNDVGLSFVQDIPDQECAIVSNYSADVLLMDYGDSCVEPMVLSQGLREESPASYGVFPTGDIDNYYSYCPSHQHWRLYDTNRRNAVTQAITSTSNGGAGY